jgi:hypothetical protein
MFQLRTLVFCFLLKFLKSDAQNPFLIPCECHNNVFHYHRPDFPKYIHYHQPDSNYRPTAYQQLSPACANFFSYRIDQNGKFAVVALPNPDRVRNILKVQMSLGVRITTVNI